MNIRKLVGVPILTCRLKVSAKKSAANTCVIYIIYIIYTTLIRSNNYREGTTLVTAHEYRISHPSERKRNGIDSLMFLLEMFRSVYVPMLKP